MRKSNITGWKDVFSFTLTQTLKSKAFIISYIILLVLAIFATPLMNNFLGDVQVDENQPSPIEKVYVKNSTSLPNIDFTTLTEDETLKHLEFEIIKDNFDAIADKIEEKEETSVILTIKEDLGFYNLEFLKASKGPVKDNNMYYLGDMITEKFYTFFINAMGIDQNQLDSIYESVETTVIYADAAGNPIIDEDEDEAFSISLGEYWFVYIILFAVMMVNMVGGSQVATSIVIEKSSRVVETLLISIRPLALIVGKVLAMLTIVLGQLIILVSVFLISNKLTNSSGNSLITYYLSEDIYKNINIGNIILCLIVILLAFIFYATLAGLTGATVSKLEDVASSMTLFYICNFVGLYMSLFTAGMMVEIGVSTFTKFVFIFPLSSPFILPGAILIGKVTTPIILISISLLVLLVILLFRFTANVYETLILHNGNPIKTKELFKMSRNA